MEVSMTRRTNFASKYSCFLKQDKCLGRESWDLQKSTRVCEFFQSLENILCHKGCLFLPLFSSHCKLKRFDSHREFAFLLFKSLLAIGSSDAFFFKKTLFPFFNSVGLACTVFFLNQVSFIICFCIFIVFLLQWFLHLLVQYCIAFHGMTARHHILEMQITNKPANCSSLCDDGKADDSSNHLINVYDRIKAGWVGYLS